MLFKNIIYIMNSADMKHLILDEIHKKPYSSHLGYLNIITTLKKDYYWLNMKTRVAKYLSRCLECQQVKAKHHHPA